jgi:superfamily II RNA helicase
MQTLTLDDVLKAGRAAYEAKTLTAQSTNPACVYRDRVTGCKCVVGSAMTDETLDEIQSLHAMSSRVTALSRQQKIIAFADAEAESTIAGLQEAHDQWCRTLNTSSVHSIVRAAEADFVRLLYR